MAGAYRASPDLNQSLPSRLRKEPPYSVTISHLRSKCNPDLIIGRHSRTGPHSNSPLAGGTLFVILSISLEPNRPNLRFAMLQSHVESSAPSQFAVLDRARRLPAVDSRRPDQQQFPAIVSYFLDCTLRCIALRVSTALPPREARSKKEYRRTPRREKERSKAKSLIVIISAFLSEESRCINQHSKVKLAALLKSKNIICTTSNFLQPRLSLLVFLFLSQFSARFAGCCDGIIQMSIKHNCGNAF